MLQVIIKPRLKLFQPSLFFGHTKVFARKGAMLKLQKRGGSGASQRELFPPLPLPLFSFAPSYFYSPQSQSSSLTKSKMAAMNINKHKPLGTAHN